MEAATSPPRSLDSDKAKRIVSAMRESVGERGAAASTFDQVAQAAGVSRGLLHYYFGTKERLLVEVLRHDAALRMGRLEERAANADSLDALIDTLVTELEEHVREDPGSQAVLYEMFSLARRNEEIRRELATLYRMHRARLAELLRAKERDGVIGLRDDADAVAAVIMALGDGMLLQLVADPDWDSSPAFRSGVDVVRFLFGAD
jgi:AcrR family transcriptional regulator